VKIAGCRRPRQAPSHQGFEQSRKRCPPQRGAKPRRALVGDAPHIVLALDLSSSPENDGRRGQIHIPVKHILTSSASQAPHRRRQLHRWRNHQTEQNSCTGVGPVREVQRSSRSGSTQPHKPITGTGARAGDVEDGLEDIIPPRQRCLHHACATGKPTPKGTYSTLPGRKAAFPSTSEVYRPPDAKGAEALAGGSTEPRNHLPFRLSRL